MQQDVLCCLYQPVWTVVSKVNVICVGLAHCLINTRMYTCSLQSALAGCQTHIIIFFIYWIFNCSLFFTLLLLCIFSTIRFWTCSKVKSLYLLPLRSNSVSVKSDQWSLSYNIYAIWCWCLLVNNLFNCVPFCDQLNFIK